MSAVETLEGAPMPKIRHGALVFDRRGPKAALADCVAFLQARGFTVGRWQKGVPCAVMFSDREMPRWSDIPPEDRLSLHGLIMGNAQHGPLVVKLTSSAPEAAHLAIGTQ